MRPTRRLLAIAFALAVASLGLAAWQALDRGLVLGIEPRTLVLLAWTALAFLVLVDRLLTPGGGGLTLRVDAPTETFVGEPVPIALRFEGRLPRAPVRLRAELPAILHGDGEAVPDAEGRAELRPVAEERGTALLARVDALWRSRLGLLEMVPRFRTAARIAVVPNIRAVRSGAIDLMIREALFGEKQTAFRGEGSEFHQLSEFQFGMDTRAIDWKSTARHRDLMVREMRAERNHPVVLALDNGHLMRERMGDAEGRSLAKVDHQIRAALALAWGVVQSGDLVGLFAFDARPRDWVPPAGGRRAFATLRAATAGLSYRSEQTNHTLGLSTLAARLQRRSLVVVFSDFVDTTTAELLVENAAVLSKRHVVVFVAISDPELKRTATAPAETLEDVARAVSAAQMLADRQAVFERLNRLGVEVVEALPGQLVADVLRAYLRIKLKEAI